MKTKTTGTEIPVEISHLSKKYGQTTAVDDLSLTVQQGEIFGLLGPNGAGKSSTLECALGTRSMDSGSVRILGLDPVKHRKQLFTNVGVQFQASHYHGFIRVAELCQLTESLYPDTVPWRSLLAQFGLDDFSKHYVADLSGGERQKLSLVLTLIPNPKLVFLDELTTGLDPIARREVWHLLTQLREQGLTIFLTSHYMDEVETLCDRIAILQHGRIIKQGRVTELMQNSNHQRLEDAYIDWLAA